VSNGSANNKKLSEAITKTLPFLRRYARAVTGSQQRGDEWVRLCAEVAVRGGSLEIEWSGEGSPVLMTGPAETVYHGEMEWPN